MAQYADYSGGRPSAAALKAAGFSGVVRYVGPGSPGKLLTASEYRDLTAGGLDVLLVAELGTGDSWGTSTDDDYGRGRGNSLSGLNHAKNCGVPDSKLFIYGASDAHTSTQWQITDTVDYMRGFRDVLGWNREGHYGFSDTNVAVHNSGVSSGFWRCGSQPSTADKAWVNLWQRNVAPSARTVSGVVCDINEFYRSPLQEDDMVTKEEIDAIAGAVLQRFYDARPNGRNPWDYGQQLIWNTEDLKVRLAGLPAGVSADEVAAKILPALTASLAAEVAKLDVSNLDTISDEDAQKIAAAVTGRAAALLAPSTGAQ